MSKITAQQFLEEKYNLSVKVTSVEYSSGQDLHIVTAHPSEQSDFVFRAEFTKEGVFKHCNYPQLHWSQQATALVKEELADSAFKNVLKVTFYNLSKHPFDEKKLPSFNEMVQAEGIKSRVDVHSHFFADADKEEELQAVINSIHPVLVALHKKNISNIYFYVAIYKKSIGTTKDLTSFKYGYNELKPDYFEDVHQDDLLKRLVFELEGNQALPTVEQLRAIVDESPSYFGSKVRRFQ